jgi:hypothetical protein
VCISFRHGISQIKKDLSPVPPAEDVPGKRWAWPEEAASISSCFLVVKIHKVRNIFPDRVLAFYSGPVSVGRNHPAMEVTIHKATAIIRDLTQPMEYRFCNASSHTIPGMNAASRALPNR